MFCQGGPTSTKLAILALIMHGQIIRTSVTLVRSTLLTSPTLLMEPVRFDLFCDTCFYEAGLFFGLSCN